MRRLSLALVVVVACGDDPQVEGGSEDGNAATETSGADESDIFEVDIDVELCATSQLSTSDEDLLPRHVRVTVLAGTELGGFTSIEPTSIGDAELQPLAPLAVLAVGFNGQQTETDASRGYVVHETDVFFSDYRDGTRVVVVEQGVGTGELDFRASFDSLESRMRASDATFFYARLRPPEDGTFGASTSAIPMVPCDAYEGANSVYTVTTDDGVVVLHRELRGLEPLGLFTLSRIESVEFNLNRFSEAPALRDVAYRPASDLEVAYSAHAWIDPPAADGTCSVWIRGVEPGGTGSDIIGEDCDGAELWREPIQSVSREP